MQREKNGFAWTLVQVAVLACLVLSVGCSARRVPESPDDAAQRRGQSSFDFLHNGASMDSIPPEDQELRPPVIAEELVLPVYPESALAAGAGPSTVAVRILVDTGPLCRRFPSVCGSGAGGVGLLARLLAALRTGGGSGR